MENIIDLPTPDFSCFGPNRPPQPFKEYGQNPLHRFRYNIPMPLNYLQSVFISNSPYKNIEEYSDNIISHIFYKEIDTKIPTNYLSLLKTDVEPKYRSILINWIYQVYLSLKLQKQTFFTSISIVDRLFSKREVVKRKIHLVGIGSLLIASKYAEVCSHEIPIDDLIICSERAYSRDEILSMERVILNILDYELCFPTTLSFVNLFLAAFSPDSKTEVFVDYISKVSTSNYDLLQFVPSQIAASSVYLAVRICQSPSDTTKSINTFLTYCENHMNSCINKLKTFVLEQEKLKGCFYKSYSNKYSEFSLKHSNLLRI